MARMPLPGWIPLLERVFRSFGPPPKPGRARLLACLLTIVAGLSGAPVSAIGAGGFAGVIVKNEGQTAEQVRYYALQQDVVLYFLDGAIVLDWPGRGHSVRARFAGAHPAPALIPGCPLPTRLNYFVGSDPTRWSHDLPTCSELTYRGLWTGVDLVVRPGRDGIRYSVRTDAGAVPSPARFEFDGTDSITGGNGPAAEITEMMAGGVRLTDEPTNAAGTERILRWGPLPSDDPSPAADGPRDNPAGLSWSTFLGGTDNDYAHGLILDPAGQPLVTGYAWSPNFPVTPGAYDTSQNGSYDVFVVKLDASGSNVLWGTFLGGALEDRPFGLVFDSHGNVVVAGHTYSSDFPVTLGAYDRVLAGPRDVFVSKLSPTGSTLLWSTFVGGSGSERAWNVVIDEDDSPWIGGETTSQDFPTSATAFDRTYGGGSDDGFLARLDSAGRFLPASTYLGGTAFDWIFDLKLDHAGRPVVVGTTESANFPTTPGVFDPTPNGTGDGFVARFSTDVSALEFSTCVGGAGYDAANALMLDGEDGIVVAGPTASTNFPVTAGAWDTSYNGAGDVWVARCDSAATQLSWCTFVGGSDNEDCFAMILDHEGGPIITGESSSTDFPTTLNAFDRSYNGNRDAYLTRLSPDGSVTYSTYVGGSEWDGGWDLALDASGNPLVTGPTHSWNFPVTPGAFDGTYNGGAEDVFVARFLIAPASGVDGIGPGSATGLTLRAEPNPFRGPLRLEMNLPETAGARLLILDALGRRVATMAIDGGATGRAAVVWDGRTAEGRLAPAGVYWLRLETQGRSVQTGVVSVR